MLFYRCLVFCFSEENVFKLCEDVARRYPGEIRNCSVVFVSNARRKVPLWKQRAGKDEDKLVIWVRQTIQQKNLKIKSYIRKGLPHNENVIRITIQLALRGFVIHCYLHTYQISSIQNIYTKTFMLNPSLENILKVFSIMRKT